MYLLKRVVCKLSGHRWLQETLAEMVWSDEVGHTDKVELHVMRCTRCGGWYE